VAFHFTACGDMACLFCGELRPEFAQGFWKTAGVPHTPRCGLLKQPDNEKQASYVTKLDKINLPPATSGTAEVGREIVLCHNVYLAATTSYGRIISLSSCSRMWQCQT
jgi:hypothetical protein